MVAALCWQLLTFLLPMGMVLGLWRSVALLALPWTALLVFLLGEVRRAEAGSAAPAAPRPVSSS